MISLILKTVGFIAASLFLTACEDKSNFDLTGKGDLTLKYDNRIGSSDLKLGSSQAINASGEEYTITTLNYFVSNIELMDVDGNVISFPENYFLVKESDAASQEIQLKGIPSGDYSTIKFVIGVDSLKSISDVSQRTGVLDPASYGTDNMYWSWNMGYIFFKMEGKSGASTAQNNIFQFHVGGFGGKDAPTPNNLRTIELKLTSPVEVRPSKTPTGHIVMDISKVFDSTSGIKLAETPMIHNPKVGTKVANNYVQAFSMDHLH